LSVAAPQCSLRASQGPPSTQAPSPPPRGIFRSSLVPRLFLSPLWFRVSSCLAVLPFRSTPNLLCSSFLSCCSFCLLNLIFCHGHSSARPISSARLPGALSANGLVGARTPWIRGEVISVCSPIRFFPMTLRHHIYICGIIRCMSVTSTAWCYWNRQQRARTVFSDWRSADFINPLAVGASTSSSPPSPARCMAC